MRRYPVNRLWLQLSITFAAVILLAVVVIGAVGYQLSPRVFVARVDLNEERLAALERRRNQALLSTVIVGGIVGMGAGIWVSRRLTVPLEELARGAQALSAHNLAYRVPVHGSEEVRTVGRAFNEMAAALEKAERLRQNLLADVAHELRTPLTVMLSNLRAILDDVYTLDKSEVARLYDQTRHLIGLVNDLHELAQAEARQLPLTCQSTDLDELARAALEVVEPVAELEEIDLRLEIPAEPVVVQADRVRLMQVVQNLLANALRHTQAGGSITVAVRTVGSDAELAVADTGDGIEPQHLAHLFDRFYRTDQARDRDQGGAGLGLAIVRAMVEAQGGHVAVESGGLGRGSRFIVVLPVAREALYQGVNGVRGKRASGLPGGFKA